MAADFGKSAPSEAPGPSSGPRGPHDDAYFTTDGGFDLDAMVEGDPIPEPADPLAEPSLLMGPGALDLDAADGVAHPKAKAARASGRGARPRDLARRAARQPQPPAARQPPARRGLAVAACALVAAGLAVVLGMTGRGPAPAPIPVQAPAPIVATATTPPAPVVAAVAAPVQVAQAPTPIRARVAQPAEPEVAPPPPAAVEPAAVEAAPSEPVAASPIPSASSELAQAPAEPAAERVQDAVVDCRSDGAAGDCWQARLADAEHLLVSAHLNARLAGVPVSELRVGLDDWLDANAAARDEPDARLVLLQQRMERVDMVVSAHGEPAAPPEPTPTEAVAPSAPAE